MHADVAKVSQEYLSDAKILRDRPRKSLSVTESVTPRRYFEGLLRAFLKVAVLFKSGSKHHSINYQCVRVTKHRQ